MKFELPPLPYAKDALEPAISSRTLDTHYEKHHRGYVEKLKKAIGSSPIAKQPLEEVIRQTQGKAYNFAAQVWNHTFYWNSMRPGGGGEPPPRVRDALSRDFGDVDSFRRELAEAAKGEFGSGWAWLVRNAQGRLEVISTTDAVNPLTTDKTPLLTIDVWEHAYYLDYQNDRASYVQKVIETTLNWDFVAENLAHTQAA